MYLEKYDWFFLSPTVHKILIHGPFIIENNLLPIGDLSEEALEARHKHFKLYRSSFARKFSRVATNQDIFNRLWVTSDPIINSIRKKRNIAREHSKEAKMLLLIN